MALAPVIAPSLGALLLVWFDWHSAFWALSVFGVIALLITLLYVPESLPEVQPLKIKNILSNYIELLSNRFYLGYVLSASFIYGICSG